MKKIYLSMDEQWSLIVNRKVKAVDKYKDFSYQIDLDADRQCYVYQEIDAYGKVAASGDCKVYAP